jgi:CheY-like chemotaxis protein
METQHELELIPTEKHYFGVSSFIEKHKKKDLTIFVVDDNETYLHLLKQLLDHENFSVFTFTSGEEALEYSQIKPDLLLIDFHLNSKDLTALDGDHIAELFRQRVPDIEIALISSDTKINLISELHSIKLQDVIFKDGHDLEKIVDMSNKLVNEKGKRSSYRVAFLFTLSLLLIVSFTLTYVLWMQN